MKSNNDKLILNVFVEKQRAEQEERAKHPNALADDVQEKDLYGNIDPERANQASSIICRAYDRSKQQMPWLNGVHLTDEEAHEIGLLLMDIREDLKFGRRYEHEALVRMNVNNAAMGGVLRGLIGNEDKDTKDV